MEGQAEVVQHKKVRNVSLRYTQAEKSGCVLAGIMGLATRTKGNKQRKRDGTRPSPGHGQKAEGK